MAKAEIRVHQIKKIIKTHIVFYCYCIYFDVDWYKTIIGL